MNPPPARLADGGGSRRGRCPIDGRGRPHARRHPLDPELRARRDDGTLGTVCIYQASSPEAIRRHESAAALPVDEIIEVADTVIVRDDPVPALG